MRRGEGTLTTGTYIAICNDDDSVVKVEAKGNVHQVLGTKNRNDENVEWNIESLGNDRYRCCNKTSGTSFKPSTYVEGTLIDQEREPTLFVFRETETKGDYFLSYGEYPSWYVCPSGYGGYKISADSKHARWSFFEVDN
ncbi:hypothetical protein F5887DRAFT_1071300 [Amanita rubescens]|nr:hypothetical protein F5887DRAFT_1071300 [Amanita rubescens]